jgi:hypothetical protein
LVGYTELAHKGAMGKVNRTVSRRRVVRYIRDDPDFQSIARTYFRKIWNYAAI